MTSHLAKTSKGLIEYTLFGNGPVVLVLHGMSQDCQSGECYRYLLEAGYSILTPSRPGYGRTPESIGKTAVEAADAIISLLDLLKIRKVSVIAISGGGPTGIHLAANYPDRVGKLILEAAVSNVESEDYKQESKEREVFYGRFHWLFWGMLRIMSWISLKRTTLQTLFIFSLHDKTDIMVNFPRKEYKFVRQFFGGKSSARGGRLDLAHTTGKEAMNRITAPTLVIHSLEDGSVRFYHAEYSHHNIKNSELFIAKSISHFLYWGPGSEEVMSKVILFLQENPQK